MHLKRIASPKRWPIPRKGTKLIVRPLGDLSNSVPLLIVLRDILKITRNKKETKRSLNAEMVEVNGRSVKDFRLPLSLFDVISIKPSKKNYRVMINDMNKFSIQEISSSEAKEKISKVKNKKLLRGKKLQINLSSGENFISDIKCNTGDSVVIDLENRKIKECIPMGINREALVISGKNSGQIGKILRVEKEKRKVEMKLPGRDKDIELNLDTVIVLR